MIQDKLELNQYVKSLCSEVENRYKIDYNKYRKEPIKRGLRNEDGTGVIAGVTNIGSVQGYYVMDYAKVPMEGALYYRGISVTDLVDNHMKENSFGYEETAYLLLFGKLPNKKQLSRFNTILGRSKILPDNFFEDMILKAPSKNIMNKLERSILAMYSYDDDPDNTSLENVMRQSIELIGCFPSIVADAYAVKRHIFDHDSLYKHIPDESLSASENFLRMIRKNKSYTDEEAKLLDLMMILHAEHGGGNNSAFSCRTLTSTGTDTYSAIAAAVGALKGPLHGGANAKVVTMLDDIEEHISHVNDETVRDYLKLILDKKAGDRSGKIYGIGHAVYTMSDPRAIMIKKYARKLAEKRGFGERFALIETVERIGTQLIMERNERTLPVCANVDLYSGLVYESLDIPEDLFTPLFAIARVAGWCAHRLEEILTCGRIIRPAYSSSMEYTKYVPIDERGE